MRAILWIVFVAGVIVALDGIYGAIVGSANAGKSSLEFADAVLRDEAETLAREDPANLNEIQRGRRRAADLIELTANSTESIVRASAIVQIVSGLGLDVLAVIVGKTLKRRSTGQYLSWQN